MEEFVGKKTYRIVGQPAKDRFVVRNEDGQYICEKIAPENRNNIQHMLDIFENRPVKFPNNSDGKPEERILWPVDIAYKGGEEWCVLKIGNPELYSRCNDTLGTVLRCEISVSKEVCYKICKNICQVYGLLATMDCYFNILSIEDIFFNIDTGDVCLKNIQNLIVGRLCGRVFASPVFMAPETVEGEKKIDRITNIYSVFTYLFCLLYRMHPLHGSKRSAFLEGNICLDDEKIKKIYGYDGEFVLSETDGGKDYIVDDKRVDEFFKRLYEEGLKDPKKRPDFAGGTEFFGKLQEEQREKNKSFDLKPGAGTPAIEPAGRVIIESAFYNGSFKPINYTQILKGLSFFGMAVNGSPDMIFDGGDGYFYFKNVTCELCEYYDEGNPGHSYCLLAGQQVKMIKGRVIRYSSVLLKTEIMFRFE